MKVSTRSWHGRAYRWWTNHPATNWRWRLDNERRPQENLCHYVRVVLFWVPAFWLAFHHPKRVPWLRPWIVAVTAAFIAALVVGFRRWPAGTGNTLLAIAIGCGCIVALLGFAVALSWGGGLIQAYSERGRRHPRDPSFLRVIWAWVKARKQRICPFIEIIDHTKEPA